MDAAALLAHRLANHRLTRPEPAPPAAMVAWLGAVQSQDYAGAKWGLGLRLQGVDDAAIDAAFDAGEIVRTHVLRPTWHFVAPADLRWLLRLTAPRVKAALAHNDRVLGVDAVFVARTQGVIAKALGGRTLTRPEIERALAEAGVPAKGQLLAHVLAHAELDALICSGPRRGKQHTYALLDERVPPTPTFDRDEALAELARRYFRSHGPATARDFAWWSGLTVGDARRGIAALGSDLVSERIVGLDYWLVPLEPAPVPETVFLLPNYDEYTVAYRDRAVYFDAASAPATARGPAVSFDNAILHRGRVAGTWRRTFSKDGVTVETHPFGDIPPEALHPAAERYAAFLGLRLA